VDDYKRGVARLDFGVHRGFEREGEDAEKEEPEGDAGQQQICAGLGDGCSHGGELRLDFARGFNRSACCEGSHCDEAQTYRRDEAKACSVLPCKSACAEDQDR